MAILDLTKAVAEGMARNLEGLYDPVPRTVGPLRGHITMLRVIQEKTLKNWGTPSEAGKTERERPGQYVEKLEKRVELMITAVPS